MYSPTAPHKTRCAGASACWISKLYDQSGKGNDLIVAGPGGYVKTADTESNAKGRSLMVGGHKVYALYMASDSSFGSSTGPTHDGYRNNKATGLPTGNAAQGEYMIVDGKRANAGCCWDFGTAKRDSTAGGHRHDASHFLWHEVRLGHGSGQWPMVLGRFRTGACGRRDREPLPHRTPTTRP